MRTASELMVAIEAAGGSLRVEGALLKASLPEMCRPMVEELRSRKAEILALLLSRASAPGTMATPDPAVWWEEFETWVQAECGFHDRCWGEVSALQHRFREWCQANGSVPCTRDGFEWLLTELYAGMPCPRIQEGMIYGLILKEDRQASSGCPTYSTAPIPG